MRSYCEHCHYPSVTCVCEAISPIENSPLTIILQHPSEATHAKNTARLVPLSLTNTHTFTGIAEGDFSAAKALLKNRNSCVIYPGETSQSMENEGNIKPDALVFIDASWRQAYAIWQQNSWLHHLPQFHFDNAPANRYRIRKTERDDSLSTLEAIAYSWHYFNQTDTTPLYKLLDKMQQFWRGN